MHADRRFSRQFCNLLATADVIAFGDLYIVHIGIDKGDFGFLDVRNQKVKGHAKLETELTLREGNVVWDLNGLVANEFKK